MIVQYTQRQWEKKLRDDLGLEKTNIQITSVSEVWRTTNGKFVQVPIISELMPDFKKYPHFLFEEVAEQVKRLAD